VAERALTGTWVMDEVRMAVKKDYRMLQVYEVYEYRNTNTMPNWGGLFVDYRTTF
jgi:hypothetical protein